MLIVASIGLDPSFLYEILYPQESAVRRLEAWTWERLWMKGADGEGMIGRESGWEGERLGGRVMGEWRLRSDNRAGAEKRCGDFGLCWKRRGGRKLVL